MASNGRRGFLGVIAIAISLFAFFGVFMFSCETDNVVVNLAVKKEDKVYLFSKMGSFIVNNSIENDESPSAFPFIQVFDDNGLFVAPNNVEDIANLLSGNMNIHLYQEKSCDGYITAGEEKLIETSRKTITTENIGEQIQENTIEITHPTNGNTLKIKWEWNPKTSENKAIENCEVKSFWIETSVQPGETVTSSEDFIMLNINTLVEFYDNGKSLELDEDQQILYIIND